MAFDTSAERAMMYYLGEGLAILTVISFAVSTIGLSKQKVRFFQAFWGVILGLGLMVYGDASSQKPPTPPPTPVADVGRKSEATSATPSTPEPDMAAAFAATAQPPAAPITNPGKPWSGPHWKHARRKTALDQTFPPTEAGRMDLTYRLRGIEDDEYAAMVCELRPSRWISQLQSHIIEILEDQGTLLGDPSGFDAAKSKREVEIGENVDRYSKMTAQERDAIDLCSDAAKPGALADADEIERRPLLRHHDEWEGAGGH